MNSLFIRIFLWFWLAMVVLGLTLAWTTAQLGGREIPPMLEHARESFDADSREAWRVLERDGVEALRDWYRDAAHRRVLRLHVVDVSGLELIGGPLPPELRRFAFMPEAYLDRVPEIRRRRIVVRSLAVPGRGYLRLIAVFLPPHPVWYLFTFSRFFIVLFVSALVCWGLAYSLSAPVRQLRRVTQRLTEGDLDARVGGRLLRRRDELGRLAGDLNGMAARLQGLLESQRQLLADISHELRSPLARLQIAVGLARRRAQSGIEGELDRIEREAERLNELIGGVLTLTQLSAGGEGGFASFDLQAVVAAIVRDAEFEAADRACHVELMAPGSPLPFRGNPQLIRSAIENIVRNALRHTAEGSTVSVSLTPEGGGTDWIVVTVRDHGPGIDEAMLDEVFEPFVRADAARDRQTGGYGLGLSIARRAIEVHGGTIRARNREQGLEVEIRLPVPADGAGPPGAARPRPT